MSQTAPSIGDKVFNLAAPAGIFGKGMVPILEGYYSGTLGEAAIYSILATGGSSGSPVFNYKGQLVGMIHSVYRAFPALSRGPNYDVLKSFVESTIQEHEKKLFFKQVLDIIMKVSTMFKPIPYS